jgi:hypothetical protein
MEKMEVLKTRTDDLNWFRGNYDSLRKNFDKQWVVVQNKSVVANYSTYDEVMKKLKDDKSKRNSIVEFIDSEQIAMFF